MSVNKWIVVDLKRYNSVPEKHYIVTAIFVIVILCINAAVITFRLASNKFVQVLFTKCFIIQIFVIIDQDC